MPVCACCNKADESHKLVNCCICKKAYRIDCVKISVAEARRIHTRSGLSWTCKSCMALGDDLIGLKSSIVSLQDEIRVLKESLTQSTTLAKPSLIDLESVIQEIADRDRRKNNIIIFGSLESEDGDAAGQHNLDTSLAHEICSSVQLDAQVFKVSRLGKFDPTAVNRKRPLRVSFSSDTCVKTILRNISKLRSNPKFSSVSIFQDRTPLQLQIYKDAKTELNNRLLAGETNLKIKYNKGIPNIVPSLN